jgi:hypothetical protein
LGIKAISLASKSSVKIKTIFGWELVRLAVVVGVALLLTLAELLEERVAVLVGVVGEATPGVGVAVKTGVVVEELREGCAIEGVPRSPQAARSKLRSISHPIPKVANEVFNFTKKALLFF